MSVREYIGARYVPLFMGDWNIENAYEPLSIVTHQGNSYTSRQSVPSGIPITDETYWALTGNYNAQIDAYRHEVQAFDSRIEANSDAIADFNEELGTFENNVDARFTAFEGKIVDKPLKDKTIVVYGDSTMVESGFGTTSLYILIAEATGATVINRAVGGTAIGGAGGLIELLNSATASDFTNVDYCFFAYSTNDWGRSTPISELNVTSFEAQLKTAFNRFNDIAPNTTPVFITPVGGLYQFVSPRKTFIDYNFAGARLEDYVNAALYICHEYNFPCIDLFHLYAFDDDKIKQHFTRSSTNPSALEYNIWVHYGQELKERIANDINYLYPFNVPITPYAAHRGSILFAGSNLLVDSEVTAEAITILREREPLRYPSTPVHYVDSTTGDITFGCTLNGDNTLVFSKKTTNEPLYVYVNNELLCAVNASMVTAIRIIGVVGARNESTVKFSSNAGTWICAAQMFNGCARAVNDYNTQNYITLSGANVSKGAGVGNISGMLVYGNDFTHFSITVNVNAVISAFSTIATFPIIINPYKSNTPVLAMLRRGGSFSMIPVYIASTPNWNFLVSAVALQANDIIYITTEMPNVYPSN